MPTKFAGYVPKAIFNYFGYTPSVGLSINSINFIYKNFLENELGVVHRIQGGKCEQLRVWITI